jgi:hypothetical protein
MEQCVACGGQFLLDTNHREIELLSELPRGAKLTPTKFVFDNDDE